MCWQHWAPGWGGQEGCLQNPIAPHGQTGRGSLLGLRNGAGERKQSVRAATARLDLVWVLLALL